MRLNVAKEMQIEFKAVSNIDELFQAFKLVYQQYLKFGYTQPRPAELRFFLRDLLPVSQCFVAMLDGEVIGTAASVQYSKIGLPCSNSFQPEIENLRAQARSLMESTKFACIANERGLEARNAGRSEVASRLLKLLFDWCEQIGCDDWLIVINPKHVPYYRDDLGFEVIGQERVCPHVRSAPGVLLRLDVKAIKSGLAPISSQTEELFLSHRTQHRIGAPARALEEQIAVFGLCDPHQFLNSSASETQMLFEHYPALLDLNEKLTKLNQDLGITTEQAERLRRLYIEHDPASMLVSHSKADVFSLKQELENFFLPLSMRVQRVKMNLNWQIHSDVPDLLGLDLFAMLCALLATVDDSIKAAPPYSEIMVEVSIDKKLYLTQFDKPSDLMLNSSKETNCSELLSLSSPTYKTFDLQFSIRGGVARVSNRCRQALNVLAGHAWLSNRHRIDTCCEMRIPAIQVSQDPELANPFNLSEKYKALLKARRARNKNVLLLEQDLINKKIVQHCLSSRGHLVHSQLDSLFKIDDKHHKFDIVIVDRQVSSSFINAIREHDRNTGQRTPILALGHGFTVSSEIRDQIDDSIPTPISPARFLATLDHVVGN